MNPEQERAAEELCRRVLVCYLERHAKVWASAGSDVGAQICDAMAARLRGGSSLELHHLQMAIKAASREEGTG